MGPKEIRQNTTWDYEVRGPANVKSKKNSPRMMEN